MKKQILISRCEECPYFEVLDSIYGVKENITPYPVCHLKHMVISCNTTTQIDPSCPLEDADNEETHYMVPKSTLQTAYAKIEGIIIDKNLHPSQCGYTAEIWNVRNELKEILGYGD